MESYFCNGWCFVKAYFWPGRCLGRCFVEAYCVTCHYIRGSLSCALQGASLISLLPPRCIGDLGASFCVHVACFFFCGAFAWLLLWLHVKKLCSSHISKCPVALGATAAAAAAAAEAATAAATAAATTAVAAAIEVLPRPLLQLMLVLPLLLA